MANLILEILGWCGAALILLAYFLLTSGKLTSQSKIYHGMSLIGGITVAINAIFNGAFPPAALNIIWSIIAVYGLAKGIKLFKKKPKRITEEKK